MTIASTGGTVTLGLYDTQSQLKTKADITYVDNKVDPLQAGHKGYATLAQAQAAQSGLAANTVVEVLSDTAETNNGYYLWNGTTLTKTTFSPLVQAKSYSDSKLQTVNIDLIDLQEKMIFGGDHLYAKDSSAFVFDGYVNSSGTFVSSAAGYKTTDFIPVSNGSLKFSLRSSIGQAVVSFYDTNKQFISGIVGNDSNAERTGSIPSNAIYCRFTNNSTANTTPYATGVFTSILSDPSLITAADFTLEKSLNLAYPALITTGSYVNSSGGITTAAGWKYIKIPVVAGETYSFGNFVIDTGGYYAFYTDANVLVAGAYAAFTIGVLPKTVVAPATAGYLLIDIARPTNTVEQHSQLMINVGSVLLPYVEPIDTIIQIDGKNLAGSGAGGGTDPNAVHQNGSAILTDVVADSVTTGALIANLPTSPTGLEVGQAYIDTATATIKVVI